jgi:hypothetical protein
MKVQLRLTRSNEFQGLVYATITMEDDYKSVQEERRKNTHMEPKRFSNLQT